MKCVYRITNKLNGKTYIGSTINFKKRIRSHFYNLRKNVHGNRHLQNSFNKHGEDSFIVRILEKVYHTSKVIDKEQKWVDKLNPEYNICKVQVNTSLGIKRSKETREKIRQANLGLKHPEWRNKLKSKAQGGKNHWTQTKKFTKKARKNMSNAQKKLYKNGYEHPNKVTIIQYDLDMNFVKKWSSISEAARFYNNGGIGNCVRGLSKTSAGYIWKYE